MTPEVILGTVRAGLEALTETMKFLQTDEGKKLVNKSLEDRAAWDKFWAEAGSVLKAFFRGEYFK